MSSVDVGNWLVRIGIVDRSHLNHEDGLEMSLFSLLKDGTVLCRLINLLKPGSIQKVYEQPSSYEERHINIDNFLTACQDLGVKESELFDSTDLDKEENLNRVLRTLESLENKSEEHGFARDISEQDSKNAVDIASTDKDDCGKTSKSSDLEMTEEKEGVVSPHAGVHLVKATFPFNGTDDDELCFGKGDIVEVTKVVDGGWWEGTFNGCHGWFPSNYVKEISASPEPTTPNAVPSPSPSLPTASRESVTVYHTLVVQNILDTERAHVSELQALLQNYLKPLQSSNILSPKDLKVLCGNFEELVKFQQSLFSILDECSHLPLQTQRMGACFLKVAPQMKELYLTYCANHPRAVEVLTRFSEELSTFIESKGAPSPGILTLTTSLSKPFRHLDKYPTLLKELERHLEEDHVDELDTKKGIAVFQNINTSCHEIRKKKETELEMLTGQIEGWDEDISKLGDLILMSPFLIHGDEGEVRERYFLLFPTYLVVLSVSAKLSGYCFEKKYDLTGLTVRSLEDTEGILNAFELKVNGTVMKLSTNHTREKNAWLEALQPGYSPKGASPTFQGSPSSVTSPWRERLTPPPSKGEKQPTPPHSESSGSPPGSTQVIKSSGSVSLPISSGSPLPVEFTKRSMSASHSTTTEFSQLSSAPRTPRRKGKWDFTRLRPTPPLRPEFALIAKEDSSSGKSMKGLLHSTRKKQGGCLVNPLTSFKTCTADCRSKSDTDDDRASHVSSKIRASGASVLTAGQAHVLEEDMLILRVIESYCTSARTRHTLNCSPITPEVPPHRTESQATIKSDVWKTRKLSKKEKKRDAAAVEFNCLRRKVDELQSETNLLRQSLQEEQDARRKMEKFIRNSLKGIVPDFKWEEMSNNF